MKNLNLNTNRNLTLNVVNIMLCNRPSRGSSVFNKFHLMT